VAQSNAGVVVPLYGDKLTIFGANHGVNGAVFVAAFSTPYKS
jgi:hypothetical protein